MVITSERVTYLGSHEFRCTAESTGRRSIPHLFLAQPVICDLDVTIEGQQNVVELQIPVDDAVLVEVFQC